MLADRSQPIFPEPKQANTRVETSTRERSLPSVVAFSSQRSLCLRNVLSSATNVVSVLIFSIDFTRHSKHCVSPPLARIAPDLASAKPYRTLSMPPFDRSFYQRHEEETRLRELHRGSRGEGGGGWKEEGEKRRGEEKGGKKRFTKRTCKW